jgi:hypothetical protein
MFVFIESLMFSEHSLYQQLIIQGLVPLTCAVAAEVEALIKQGHL